MFCTIEEANAYLTERYADESDKLSIWDALTDAEKTAKLTKAKDDLYYFSNYIEGEIFIDLNDFPNQSLTVQVRFKDANVQRAWYVLHNFQAIHDTMRSNGVTVYKTGSNTEINVKSGKRFELDYETYRIIAEFIDNSVTYTL